MFNSDTLIAAAVLIGVLRRLFPLSGVGGRRPLEEFQQYVSEIHPQLGPVSRLRGESHGIVLSVSSPCVPRS